MAVEETEGCREDVLPHGGQKAGERTEGNSRDGGP
jgi:hypothetical protein